jgi:PTS system fructose-specific IIC component
MAAEALRKTASLMRHDIKVEVHGADGTSGALSEEDIAAADVVIFADDIHVERERFADKLLYETSTSRAIRRTRDVLECALALLPRGVNRAGGRSSYAGRARARRARRGGRGRGGRRRGERARQTDRRYYGLPDGHRAHVHGGRRADQGGAGARR